MALLPSRIGKKLSYTTKLFSALAAGPIFFTFAVTELGLRNYHFLRLRNLKFTFGPSSAHIPPE